MVAATLAADYPMRRPRLDLPGIPMHLTHRGVNRGATFVDDDDRAAYMQALEVAASAQQVAIHAYVLMSNHVHLLVSTTQVGGVSRMMQAVGRRYVRTFNARHRRSGTLWEGRFKSCLVDSDRYLLTCMRYIELNPVRAAIVGAPWEHRWSSVHAHLGLRHDARWTPHAAFLALGANEELRRAAYRALLTESVSTDDLTTIRDHMRQERALGSPRFHAMVEQALGRPAAIRRPGRPPAAANSNSYVLWSGPPFTDT
ncbi:MAG: transposase [Lysobacteraceae bacterium]